MKKEDKSFAVHFIAGIFAGALSFWIGRKLYALFIMVGLLAILINILNRLLGKEKIDFWIKNGAWIYVFVWVISWTILYNL